ncbi:MAG: hypothetical protein N2C14_25500 [Planctomycetales bacterium]
MGIDVGHYHGWEGRLRSPWIACLAIVRVALLQVFRRKGYWIVLALGMLNFLMFFALIYFSTQLPSLLPGPLRGRVHRGDMASRMGFDATPQTAENGERNGRERNGYLEFMKRQSLIVTLLLAFCGSLLVVADFRQ